MDLTTGNSTDNRYRAEHRAGPAIGALLLQALVGYVLIAGLAVTIQAHAPDRLALFSLEQAPPPPAEQPHREPAKNHKANGAAAPANRTTVPTELVAPLASTPLALAAAPVKGSGAAASTGAATLPGPGTGAGGQGNGSGNGDAGSGDGDGGSGPRQIAGRIKDSDYPRALWEAGIGGTLETRIDVGADGRVSRCTVTKSSGTPTLDALTCRIITQRFRYAPAHDEQGRPEADYVEGTHVWAAHRQAEAPDPG